MTVRRWERLAGAAVCILFAAFIVWAPSSGSMISLYLLTIIPAAAAVYMVLYVLMNYLVLDASRVTEVVWGKARRYPWESAAVVDDRIPPVSSRPHVGRRQLIVILDASYEAARGIYRRAPGNHRKKLNAGRKDIKRRPRMLARTPLASYSSMKTISPS